MKKWIQILAISLMGVLAFAAVSIFLGGPTVARHYMAKSWAIGDARLTLVHPDFRWGWQITADSLKWQSPSVDVAIGRIRITADLFQSFSKWSPHIKLDIDTVQMTFVPTTKEESDTSASKNIFAKLPFPEFKIPVQAKIQIARIEMLDTLGVLAYGEGIEVSTHDSTGIGLSIDGLGSRPTGDLIFAFANAMNWQGDSLQVHLQVQRSHSDSIVIEFSAPKTDLTQGMLSLWVRTPSTQPYVNVFQIPKSVPRLSQIEWKAKASVGKGFRIQTKLNAHLDQFDTSAVYRLSPQNFQFALDYVDSVGKWSMQSVGEKQESVSLTGRLGLLQTDSLLNPGYIASQITLSAQGKISQLPLRVDGKTILAEMDLNAPVANASQVKLELKTGDGSHVAADIVRASKGWQGQFSAQILPIETWLRAFVDTQVAFTSLKIQGKVQGSHVQATTDITQLHAYGLSAHALHLKHTYGDGKYILNPSTWTTDDITWHLNGQVNIENPKKPLEFHLRHEKWGSLNFKMPKKTMLIAELENLVLDKLPYAALDTLAQYQTRVSGKAHWDMPVNQGQVDLQIHGSYQKQPLSLIASSHWNADTLVLERIRVLLEGSSLQASALVAWHGLAFGELGQLKREDIHQFTLESEQFDLAKVLGIAMPESPLLSGHLHGLLAYDRLTGLSGEYRFQNVKPRATENQMTLKYLALQGKGDSLIVLARTISDKDKWANDSLRLAVANVLDSNQGLNLFVQCDKTLNLRFIGQLRNQKELNGTLDLNGSFTPPGKAGQLNQLKIAASLYVPFKNAIDSMEIKVKTLSGDYSIADFPTQHFSAPLSIQNGHVTIPQLTLSDGKNEPLMGRVEYALTGHSKFSADLRGPSLAVQFGKENRAHLTGIHIQVKGDSTYFDALGDFQKIAVDYTDPPLRSYAELSKITATYHQSRIQKRGTLAANQEIPKLTVKATMDTSLIKYRMRSMETLKNFFRRKGQGKRVAKRNNPLDLKIKLETSGSGNSIETDILRLEYIGDFALNGVMPYALVQGRLNAIQGQLGTKNQAYAIRNMEVKWLNSPLEDGTMELEAGKQLARDCEATTTDSCQIITRLNGSLSDLKFSYDSDCQGSFGSGADVSAMLYSVRRGCFSSAFSSGGSNNYGQAALTLLEPMASQYLTAAAEKISGKWISSAQVTGLGAIGSSSKSASDSSNTSQQAIAVEILSKEMYRVRLRAKTAYTPENTEVNNPWDYRLALEWRPPVEGFFTSSKGKQRVSRQLKFEAALFTDRNTAIEGRENEARRSLGLIYNYDFWGPWGQTEFAPQDTVIQKP